MPVSLYARAVEAIDRCPNHLSVAVPKHDGQFIGKGRLPRSVWAVDRDPQRMRDVDRIDQPREPGEQPRTIKLLPGGHPSGV